MRVRNTKKYQAYSYEEVKDDEGYVTKEFVPSIILNAYIYPLSGDINLQIYGEKLQKMYEGLVDNKYSITIVDGKPKYMIGDKLLGEGDMISVFNPNKPDFIIKSISAHSHLVLKLEMI